MTGFPQVPRWRARPPSGGGSAAGMPIVSRVQLPSAFFRTPPPVAAWNTEGFLAALGTAVAAAAFTADGLLEALGAGAGLAEFSGEGVLTEVQNEGIAEFLADGLLSAPAFATATASFTAAGSLAAGAVPPAAAAFTGVGALAAPGQPSSGASFTGVGSLSAAGSSFIASGMYKNGTTQTWALSGNWNNITGWVADTTNYPGSTVDTNRLVVQSIKTDATVTAVIPWTGGGSSTRTVRLVDQTGAVIATGTGTTTSPATVTATNVNLTAITSVGVQMTSTTFSNPGSVATGTGTYVTIT